jgi:magnesium transporter
LTLIRSVLFHKDGSYQKEISIDQVKQAIQTPNGFIWVSLENSDEAEINSVLTDVFYFHPLSVEDCLSHGYQTPKVDDFTDYIFMIAHALRPDSNLESLETMELNIFIGTNYLVTCYRDDAMPPIDSVWRRLDRDNRLYLHGPDFLAHAILDSLVDDYMPILDEMDEQIEWLEDQVLATPEPKTLGRILNLKHTVMSLRRIISPQREVINRLTRDEFPQIDRQSRIYFRDIYDHLVRIQDLSENIRDIVSGAMDIYLNSTSLRLNVIMKALTIVSTIFLPLSFVAGVYGMNFHYMPELSWKWGYLFVWLIFLSILAAMIWYIRKNRWL